MSKEPVSREIALKPCPFCGSSKVYYATDMHYVECGACEANGATTAEKKDAIEAWNRRYSEDAAMEMAAEIADEHNGCTEEICLARNLNCGVTIAERIRALKGKNP